MNRSKVTVLMFGWEFPPFFTGGLGVACYGLTRSLARQGVEVLFVLPRKLDVSSDLIKFRFGRDLKAKNVFRPSSQNLGFLIYPYVTATDYVKKYRTLIHLLQNVPYAPTLYLEVLRYAEATKHIAKKEKFDLIHAHDWLSFPAGVAAKKISGRKLVVHVHATEFDRSGGDSVNEAVYKIEKEGMEEADKIIAVSNYTKKIIIDKYGVDGRKVEVVHNGIDEDYFPHYNREENSLVALKASGYKVVLFFGRITLQKGLDYFLRAAKKVLEYEPKTIFLVGGSGDMENQMINLAAAMGISDKVLFTGFLKVKEAMLAYRSADLYVMPSVSEPFGINVLESMINGTPVIVSKQSGASEAVYNILKVDFWDIEEIANKILAVLRYEPLKNHLAAEAGKEVGNLGWDKAATKCRNIYNNLID